MPNTTAFSFVVLTGLLIFFSLQYISNFGPQGLGNHRS